MSENERRKYQRIDFDLIAELTRNEQTFACQIRDLSLQGVLIRPFGVIRADIGAEFQLTIPLVEDSEKNQPIIQMTLELAHANPEGLGFHCSSIDLESITHLRQIVQLNSNPLDLLDRELELMINA